MQHPAGTAPRYSFGTWAFSFGPFAAAPWPFERVCRYAADAGYHGIEINGFRPHPHPKDYASSEKCGELAKFIGDLGLEIAAYAPDFSEVSPAVTDGRQYLEQMQDAVRFCERLKIKLLRVDTVTAPGLLTFPEFQRRWDQLVKTWRSAATMCANAGVTLVWEFEPGFWLNKASEVKALAAAVDHPSFKILFDTSHAYMVAVVGARQGPHPEVLAGGVPDLVRLLSPYIGHLHFIDSDGCLHNEETSVHAPFGHGKIDFRETVQALEPTIKELGWIGVDFCFCPTTEADGKAAVPFLNKLFNSRR